MARAQPLIPSLSPGSVPHDALMGSQSADGVMLTGGPGFRVSEALAAVVAALCVGPSLTVLGSLCDQYKL